MKRVFIIHGWGGNPDEPMLKWLGENLTSLAYSVTAPLMPNPNTPKIDDWINYLKEIIKNPDQNTILIGHSVGCQAILRFMETLSEDEEIGKVFLIAPWIIAKEDEIDEDEDPEIVRPWMETPINFEKIRRHSKDFYGIFSDNDYSVPLIANESLLKEKLGAKTMILKNMGHFTEEDMITELPEVISILNS